MASLAPPASSPATRTSEAPADGAAVASPSAAAGATRERWLTWLGAALALAGALGYLAITLPQVHKPYMYDDVPFALAATAVAETGLPYANQGYMSERGSYEHRDQWALWHPPLYIYSLGLWGRLFGSGEATLRLFGVTSGLLSALLTFLLAGALTEGTRGEKRFVGGAAVALAMLSPVVTQSALILDIDFPALLPLTLLFLWLYLSWEATPRRWMALAPLFTLLLWTKMTNPMPLLGCVVAWQVLRGNLRRAVLHAALIGGVGAATFGATWLLIGTWLGFPLEMPFQVNRLQWQHSSEVASRAYASAGAFIGALQPTVMWMGPLLTALGLATAGIRAGSLVHRWQVRRVDLLLGLLVVLVLGYVNKYAGWFPKYEVVWAFILAAAGAPLLTHALRAPLGAAVVALAAAGGVGYAVLRQVRDQWALQRTWATTEEAAFMLVALLLAPIALGWLWGVRGTVPAALAGAALGWSVAMGVVLARAPYATTYWYGTTGVEEAAAWVEANVPRDELFIAAKEISYPLRRTSWVDMESVTTLIAEGRPFTGAWLGQPIRVWAAWVREPYFKDMLARELPPLGYRVVAEFGDFQIYSR